MFAKSTLALAAAASLGAMALAPTTASARRFWPASLTIITTAVMGHGHGFRIGFVGGGYDGCYVTRRVLTPYGLSLAHRQRLLLIRTADVPFGSPGRPRGRGFRSMDQAGGPPPAPCKAKNDV